MALSNATSAGFRGTGKVSVVMGLSKTNRVQVASRGAMSLMERAELSREPSAPEKRVGVFALTLSPNGLPALEIHRPSKAARGALIKMLTANQMGDMDYELRNKTGAFLQGDDEEWILVEFWQGTDAEHLAFIERFDNLLSKREIS